MLTCFFRLRRFQDRPFQVFVLSAQTLVAFTKKKMSFFSITFVWILFSSQIKKTQEKSKQKTDIKKQLKTVLVISSVFREKGRFVLGGKGVFYFIFWKRRNILKRRNIGIFLRRPIFLPTQKTLNFFLTTPYYEKREKKKVVGKNIGIKNGKD